ncbi:MAG: alpha/beta hydrolase [Gammaproteobacteria bacterium]|jgi:pimeloyl-ACP methyl ester carboxylesterase
MSLGRLLFALLFIGLATLLVALAAAWAPDRPVEELAARWAGSPSEFRPLQGMQVHLRDEGPADDPVPVLLLHGTSASLHTWDGWVAGLAGRERVIRVDLPGFGLTGPFPHDDYGIERYLEFIAALLDALQLDQVVIAGNSFGGQVAWEFAAAMPERVAALVLVDAAGYPFRPESIPLAFQLARFPALQPLIERLLPRHVIRASLRNVYGDPARVDDALVDRYYELALREGNRRALGLRFAHVMPTKERAARIRTLTQPTLILWGGRDRLIPPESASRFASDIAGSRLVVFDRLGHVPHEEAPEETLAVVEEFLAPMR